MARTRSPDYENIRDAIMTSAAEMFAQRGYTATSIGDIAKACGCSKSRLYHYFESKEAVLYEMLTTHVDILLEKARLVLYGAQEPAERFLELIKVFLRIYATSRNRHVVMLTCLDALPRELRQELISKQRELITYVRDALLQLRPDMADGRADAHLHTMLFFGMINWTYTWYDEHGKVSPDELAERTVQLFLYGFMSLPDN